MLSAIRRLSLTLIGPSWWSWWSFFHWLFISDPILFGIVQWVDHLWHKFILLGNLKHSSCIFMSTTIVCSWKYSEKLSSSKSLKSIHYTLMSSQYKLSFVIIQEHLYSIRAKFNYISSTIRISYKVRLNSKLLVIISRIRP